MQSVTGRIRSHLAGLPHFKQGLRTTIAISLGTQKPKFNTIACHFCVSEFKFFSFRFTFIYNKMHKFKYVMDAFDNCIYLCNVQAKI